LVLPDLGYLGHGAGFKRWLADQGDPGSYDGRLPALVMKNENIGWVPGNVALVSTLGLGTVNLYGGVLNYLPPTVVPVGSLPTAYEIALVVAQADETDETDATDETDETKQNVHEN